MRKAIVLILLTFMLCEVYSAKVSMEVPAVILSGGAELVTLEVELLPGNGTVFVSTYPLVGLQTQDSIRSAFSVATQVANVNPNDYDAFIVFKNFGDAGSLDGPSGGAATTLLMLSALQNSTIRSDISVTGTIEDSGDIGLVGGVAEKAKASVDAGKRIFLIPKDYGIVDKMALTILSNEWNLTIIEVGNISEASAIAFSTEGTPFKTNVYELQPSGVAHFEKIESACNSCYLEKFRELGREMVNNGYQTLDEVSAENNSDFGDFVKFIRSDLNQSSELIDDNYVYSGANNAFLDRMEASFLLNSTITNRELKGYMQSLETCTENAAKPTVNKNNFEWVFGGEQRLTWAEGQLKDIQKAYNDSIDEQTTLELFNGALLADGWCTSADYMFETARGISGEAVDESQLKNLTAQRMGYVDDAVAKFGLDNLGDAIMHADAAGNESANGDYGGAILDADYVISYAAVVNASGGVENVTSGSLVLSNSSMWAFAYGAHSRFLLQKGDGLDSLKLSIYAKSVNDDVSNIRGIFEGAGAVQQPAVPSTGSTGSLQPNKEELVLVLAFSLLIAIALNVLQFYANRKRNKERGEEDAAHLERHNW